MAYISTYTAETMNNGIGKTAAMSCGSCTTPAETKEKTAEVVGFPNNGAELLTKGKGVPVTVKFVNEVQAGATLNINNSGAYEMRYKGAAIVADVIRAGYSATFIYDGEYYQLLSGGLDATIEGTTLILG